MLLNDPSGAPITARRLRHLSLDETRALFGENVEEELRQIHTDGVTLEVRHWRLNPYAWIGRADHPHLTLPAILLCLQVVYPFTLDEALVYAGLSDEEPPHQVNCGVDGCVTWPYWPDVGHVMIDYGSHRIEIFDAAAGGGGGMPSEVSVAVEAALRVA